MEKLKVAIQKSGRLSEKSIELLQKCGIKISNGERKLKTSSSNFPLEVLYLRDDDIPEYVAQGVADVGIVGENEVWEQQKQLVEMDKLGFARCRLSLAIPKDENYTDINYFSEKRIATSYPKILKNYFNQKNIPVQVERIGGSVEIATGIGLADAIFDIVSTGSTLLMNGLKEVEVVCQSEAILIAHPSLSELKSKIVDNLLFRIKAVKMASENKYILLNAPNSSIETISNILPGMKSPTILPLAKEGWSSIHSVVREDDFWETIDKLKQAGAEGLLVVPIEKMVV